MFNEDNVNSSARSESSNQGAFSGEQGDSSYKENKPRRDTSTFRESRGSNFSQSSGRRDNNFRPGGKKKSFFAKKVCKFATNQIEPASIDYKNVDLLKRFIMPSGKITPRRITGTSSKYQRVLSREIKKARIMGLLPFSAR